MRNVYIVTPGNPKMIVNVYIKQHMINNDKATKSIYTH